MDYDDNTLLNGFKFAIFKKDEGWLGYENKAVTYGNSWSNAAKFTTGSGYCGIQSYPGEFTLSGLLYGYYYVFEIGTNGKDYSLVGQKYCNTVSGDSAYYNDEWLMMENEQPLNRILCGSRLWKLGLLDVGMQDGSEFDFRFSNSKEIGSLNCIRLANHEGPYEYTDKETGETEIRNATKHATYTIRNRKDTELKIVKKDADTKKPIEGVGIKILVYLRENILYIDKEDNDTSKAYPTRQWYWLKSDGSLTQDYKNATTFRTNEDGKIELDKVPYGVYRIYETEAAEGYKLEEQKGYKKAKPDGYNLDDNRDDKFFDGDYAELDRKIIIPKTSTTNNVVLNGNYNIQYNANTNYIIDLFDDNSTSSHWGVKLYKYASNSNEDGYKGQTIRVSYVERGNYLLFNANSKKYISCQTDAKEGEYLKDAIIEDSQQGKTEKFTASRQQWQLILQDDGSFNIKTRAGGKEQTNLHVRGGKAENGARIILQKQESSNNQKFRLKPKTSIYQVPTDDNGSRKIEIEVENKPAALKLIIKKVDGTYKKDMGSAEDIYLSGAEYKIYGTNLNDDSNPGWVKQTNVDGIIQTEYKSYSEATTFISDQNGSVDIDNLKKGTYYVFETKAPAGYDIKAQDGYRNNIVHIGDDLSEISITSQAEGQDRNEIKEYEGETFEIPATNEIEDYDWVFLGFDTTERVETKMEFNNKKYVSLKGKVWIDTPIGKDNAYNSLYDSQDLNTQNETVSKDVLLRGITVNLYYNKNGKNELISTTSTGENGEYEFKNKTNGEKLTYWEMAYCYVEFIYDNKEYVIANPFVGDNLQINSKAQELEITNEELYDANLTGTEGVLPGKAITNPGLTGELNNTILENNKNAENSEKILTSFYNNDTYTIEDINLGLIKKIDPTFAIDQEIEYVKIKRGDYTFTYKMRT